jgi:hypothetical protein
MEGYCWPLSVAPGEPIRFFASTTASTYSVTCVRFANNDPSAVDDAVIAAGGEIIEVAASDTFRLSGQLQLPRPGSASAIEDWGWVVSFSQVIPPEWRSGVYAARCVDDDGTAFFIAFVVKPDPARRSGLFALANLCTWNAYNDRGDPPIDRYSTGDEGFPVPASGRGITLLRPSPDLINLQIHDDTSGTAGYGFYSKSLLRGELWVLNWLAQSGYPVDVYTDLDFHGGIDQVGEYAALLLSTHPEYWSVEMYKNLALYLAQGGCLVNLGGNALFDSVVVSDDLSTLTYFGEWPSRTRLLGQIVCSRQSNAMRAAMLRIQTPNAAFATHRGAAPTRHSRNGRKFHVVT